MAIDLNPNEQQRLIQDTARDFFQRHSSPTIVRQHEKSGEDYSRDLWRQMAELGLLGMRFPAVYGGEECSFLDLYGLYVEAGRHLIPCPLLDTVGLCGELIAAVGSEAHKKALLPRIAKGELIVAPAILEESGLFGANGIAMSARRQGDGFVLSGTKLLVPCAKSAGYLLCAARTSGTGADGISLFLVKADTRGITHEKLDNLASAPHYAVTFDKVEVAAGDVLGVVDQGWKPLNDTMMKAAVLQSAMMVGAGERALEITTNYAKERVQFGTPIGKHQAVQYLVTNIAIDVHLARLLTLQAAWRISTERPYLREASMAKAAASKAAITLIHCSHETHAGIAFMIDYDLQLYTRRAKLWQHSLGDDRYHYERALAESGI